MPVLEDDELIFQFPSIDPHAKFSISLQRTLRVPDSEEAYPLPPGFGNFPLFHTDDYAGHLPSKVANRGGVFMPMWQSEALWINLNNIGLNPDFPFPVAVKIATGKVNVISGEPWRAGLNRDPQDYVVSPDQLWVDGYLTDEGKIRQFVAMPMRNKFTVEEQITGEAKWGGIQLSVTPLKKEVWRLRRAANTVIVSYMRNTLTLVETLGVGQGGVMRQPIYRDPFNEEDWDIEATERVFVSIIDAKDWKNVTGFEIPTSPPDAKLYDENNLPWFEYYGKDQDTLFGQPKLKNLFSAAANTKNHPDIESINHDLTFPKSVSQIDDRRDAFLRYCRDEN